MGPAPWRDVHRTNAGMSSYMAIASKECSTGMRQTKMNFWDGMEHTFVMPSITAEGTAVHSGRRSVAMTNGCGVACGRGSALQPSQGRHHLGPGTAMRGWIHHRATARGLLEG